MNVTSCANQMHGIRQHPTAASWIAALVLFAFTSAVAYQSLAQDSPAEHGLTLATPSHRPFVIRQARIFDGRQVIPADSVFVQDGKIQAVGKGLKVPAGTAEIDAAGDTLLPGLIDSHSHDWGDSPRQALIFGVTTELNMAGMPKFVSKLKQAEAEGKGLDTADLRSAGNVVTPPKGHGTEYGVPVPTLANAAGAQQFVDERIAEGSDYIKIIYDDGHLSQNTFAKFSREDLAAVVAAAHRRRKLAIVHISSQDDARDAIGSGADGLAHLFADTAPQPEFAEYVLRHHAFAITTLSAIQTSLGTPSGASLLTNDRLAKRLSTDAQAHLKEHMPFVCTGKLENAFAAARQLHDAGVPVLAGTDAPAPGSWNGISMHGELELLVRAGFSPSEALAAATAVPATIFDLRDRGRIAPGLRADLLLVRGDPTQKITATREIVAVWKVGVGGDRSTAGQGLAK
ncbi:MAG TPA: amidohydrolase family protein [Isosphaeraceae bacterium]|nr:amidohydrolase family protein [Isosphaeraceae bacterium]